MPPRNNSCMTTSFCGPSHAVRLVSIPPPKPPGPAPGPTLRRRRGAIPAKRPGRSLKQRLQSPPRSRSNSPTRSRTSRPKTPGVNGRSRKNGHRGPQGTQGTGGGDGQSDFSVDRWKSFNHVKTHPLWRCKTTSCGRLHINQQGGIPFTFGARSPPGAPSGPCVACSPCSQGQPGAKAPGDRRAGGGRWRGGLEPRNAGEGRSPKGTSGAWQILERVPNAPLSKKRPDNQRTGGTTLTWELCPCPISHCRRLMGRGRPTQATKKAARENRPTLSRPIRDVGGKQTDRPCHGPIRDIVPVRRRRAEGSASSPYLSPPFR